MEDDAPEVTVDCSRRPSVSSTDSSLVQPALAPSIFDQSILNWQSLQEWAQKTWAKHHQQSVDSSGVQPIYEQKPEDSRLTAVLQSNRDSGLSSDHTDNLDDTSVESRTGICRFFLNSRLRPALMIYIHDTHCPQIYHQVSD